MHIQVDHGTRIEKPGPTAVAFSSVQQSSVILLPSAVKRECFEALKARGKSGKQAQWMFYATAVFLLVRPCLKSLTGITLDMDFAQKTMLDVRNRLWGHIREIRSDFTLDQIDFRSLGEGPAHDLAYKVYNKRAPDRIIHSTDILPFLK